MRRAIAIMLVVWCAAGASGQALTITRRSTVLLPSTTINQFGATVAVQAMSGVTYAGPAGAGHQFYAVTDNGGTLASIVLTFDAAGSITSSALVGAITVGESRDFEGAAVPAHEPGRIALSEEGAPSVYVFDLATGAKVRTVTPPAIFTSRRSNRGFESLSAAPGLGTWWTGNEEALTVDGQLSTPSAGSVVRLLLVRERPDRAPVFRQWAYVTERIHGSNVSGARSGLADLVALPNGGVLSLERSFGLASPPFLTRIFSIDFTTATEVSGFTSGLIGQTYTPVTKTLVYSGDHSNLEGLCLGPKLGADRHALVGVVDDEDPISLNHVVSFALDGPIEFGSARREPVGIEKK